MIGKDNMLEQSISCLFFSGVLFCARDKKSILTARAKPSENRREKFPAFFGGFFVFIQQYGHLPERGSL